MDGILTVDRQSDCSASLAVRTEPLSVVVVIVSFVVIAGRSDGYVG